MKTKMLLSMTTMVLVCISLSSFAQQSNWDSRHPRRDEVNDRLAMQTARIQEKADAGYMSHGEARRLHEQDHAIRSEERFMAKRHHGHITPREQRRLNRQENRVSREIRNH